MKLFLFCALLLVGALTSTKLRVADGVYLRSKIKHVLNTFPDLAIQTKETK